MLQLYCYDSLKYFPLLHACHFISQELQRGFFLLASFPFLHLINIYIYIYIFFRESFNLWRLLQMIAHYHRIKISISFWCSWGLNPWSLIQLSETLLVELTETHIIIYIWLITINHLSPQPLIIRGPLIVCGLILTEVTNITVVHPATWSVF